MLKSLSSIGKINVFTFWKYRQTNDIFFHEKDQNFLLSYFFENNTFFHVFQTWKVFVFRILETFYIFSCKFFWKHLRRGCVFYFFKNTLESYSNYRQNDFVSGNAFFLGHLSELEGKFWRAAQTVSKLPIVVTQSELS